MTQQNKKCRRCGVAKSVSEFYPHMGAKAPRDGLQAYCKQCCSKGAMERAKTPEGREYYKEWKRKWLKTEKGKQSQAKNSRRYKEKNPVKAKIRVFVGLAVELGVLVRPDRCSKCGILDVPYPNGRSSIQAHHWDYSKPLEVEWLCVRCHNAADKLMPQTEIERPMVETVLRKAKRVQGDAEEQERLFKECGYVHVA